MTIRPAKPADVPYVLPMIERLAALHQKWDPQRYDYRDDAPEMYRDWLTARAGDERAVFLVAERGDAMLQDVPFLVGFLIGTVERSLRIYKLREHGFIHDMWLDPVYRNEGTGRQLVMRAIERFTEIGVTQIRLETAADNHVARELFAACGFRVCTMEMVLEARHEGTKARRHEG